MNNINTLEVWSRYAPYLMFDVNEPFYPDAVGVTVIDQAGPSPSFRRTFDFEDERVSRVIEYAIWWDYEIGHLYELEHVWIHLGHDGEVLDCEASFHGKVLKGLLKDRSNLIDDTHVRLYSQPGKHAFSPMTEVFELLPDLYKAANENAGVDGLIVNDLFRGRIASNDEINRKVREYLRTQAFTPTLVYEEYRISVDLMMSWSKLFDIIPIRIEERLNELGLQLPLGDIG